MRAFLLSLLASLPLAATASTLQVVGPEPIREGIDRDVLEATRERFLQALLDHGAQVSEVSPEFVTTLAIQREGGSLILTARISRWKADRWSAVAVARADGAGEGALSEAVRSLAAEIARSASEASGQKDGPGLPVAPPAPSEVPAPEEAPLPPGEAADTEVAEET